MGRFIDSERDPIQPHKLEEDFWSLQLPKHLNRGEILSVLTRVRDLVPIPEKPKFPVVKMYTLEEMRARIRISSGKVEEEEAEAEAEVKEPVVDIVTKKQVEHSMRAYFVGGDRGEDETKLRPSRIFEKNGKLIVSTMEKNQDGEDETLSYGVIDFSEGSPLRQIFGNFDNLYQSLRPIFAEILLQKFQKVENTEKLAEQIEEELFTIVVEFLTLITQQENFPLLIRPNEKVSSPIFKIEPYKLLAYILKVLVLRKTQKSYLSSIFLTTTNTALKKTVEQYNSIYSVIFEATKMVELSEMDVEDEVTANEIARSKISLEDFSDKNPFSLIQGLIYPGSEKLLSQFMVLKDKEGKIIPPFQNTQITLELSRRANLAREAGQKIGIAELFIEADNIHRGIYKNLFLEIASRLPRMLACQLPLSNGEMIDVQLPIRQLLENRVSKSNELIIKVGAIWKSIGDYLASELNQAFEMLVNHIEISGKTDLIDQYIKNESQTRKYLLYASIGAALRTGKEQYQPNEYREWQWSMAGLLRNVSESKLRFLEYIARNPQAKLPTLKGRLLELIEPYQNLRTTYENMNLNVPFTIAVQDAFLLSRMLFPDQPEISVETFSQIKLRSPIFSKPQPLS